jgi:hypothetical protein
VDALGQRRRVAGGRPARRSGALACGPVFRGWFLLAGAMLCGGANGCLTWDDVTSREFDWGHPFANRQPPFEVLKTSADGDKRARALRQLREPKQNGGTDADQDFTVWVLTRAACTEREALCRLAAIQTLQNFKDPRVAAGFKDPDNGKEYSLKEAYYRADSFNSVIATTLKCAALTSLGESGNPAAVELLVHVVNELHIEEPEKERRKMEERIAAARALGHFKQYQATESLVAVLRNEGNPALRNRAHESLQEATGKDLPPDATAWANYLHQTPNQVPSNEDHPGKKILDGILPTSWLK